MPVEARRKPSDKLPRPRKRRQKLRRQGTCEARCTSGGRALLPRQAVSGPFSEPEPLEYPDARRVEGWVRLDGWSGETMRARFATFKASWPSMSVEALNDGRRCALRADSVRPR